MQSAEFGISFQLKYFGAKYFLKIVDGFIYCSCWVFLNSYVVTLFV